MYGRVANVVEPPAVGQSPGPATLTAGVESHFGVYEGLTTCR
jgi:hypothetical protein